MSNFLLNKKKKNSVRHPKMVVFRFWDRTWNLFRESTIFFKCLPKFKMVCWVARAIWSRSLSWSSITFRLPCPVILIKYLLQFLELLAIAFCSNSLICFLKLIILYTLHIPLDAEENLLHVDFSLGNWCRWLSGIHPWFFHLGLAKKIYSSSSVTIYH